MAQNKQLYIGTDSGVSVMKEDRGEWKQQGHALDDKFVKVLVAANPIHSVFACVTGEGIYGSRDDGKSWSLCFSANVHSLALDPNSPQTIYAGTEPVALFRSEDGGKSWSELKGLQNQPEEVRDRWWHPRYPHEGHVLTIFVDWHDRCVLAIGIEHGGILRSADGGEHWEDLSAGIEYLDIHTVKSDPNYSNLYYAATARGFYRSDRHGRNWTFCQRGINRSYFHDLVVIPGQRPTLLLTTANGTPPSWLRQGRSQAAIFRSTDSGLTWEQLRGCLPDSMERMIWNLTVDPENPDHLYAGTGEGLEQRSESEAIHGSVWVSTDRGNTWREVYEGPNTIRSVCVGTA